MGAEVGEWELGIVTGQEHQVQALGGVGQQTGDELVHLVRADSVVVVEYETHPLRQCLQLVSQRGLQHQRVQRLRRAE